MNEYEIIFLNNLTWLQVCLKQVKDNLNTSIEYQNVGQRFLLIENVNFLHISLEYLFDLEA